MKSRSLDIRGVGGTIQHYTTYIWYIIRPGFEKKERKKNFGIIVKRYLEIWSFIKRLKFGLICLEKEKRRNFNNLALRVFVLKVVFIYL